MYQPTPAPPAVLGGSALYARYALHVLCADVNDSIYCCILPLSCGHVYIHGTSDSKCFDKTITVVDFSFRSLFKGNGAGQGLRTSSVLVIVPANT